MRSVSESRKDTLVPMALSKYSVKSLEEILKNLEIPQAYCSPARGRMWERRERGVGGGGGEGGLVL